MTENSGGPFEQSPPTGGDVSSPALQLAPERSAPPEPAGVAFAADLALMQRVARGERDAQEELVARLLRRVGYIVQSLVGAPSEREDFVQGSLLEVFAAAKGFLGRAPLANWADSIVARHTLAGLRRSRRQALELTDGLDETYSAELEPEALSEDLARSPLTYLGELSEGARVILVLRHVLGVSLKDIAEEMDLSVPQVKKQLYYAKQRMRRLIRRDRVVGIAIRKNP